MTYDDISKALDDASKMRILASRGWQRLPDGGWAKYDHPATMIGPNLDTAWKIQERLEPIQ